MLVLPILLLQLLLRAPDTIGRMTLGFERSLKDLPLILHKVGRLRLIKPVGCTCEKSNTRGLPPAERDNLTAHRRVRRDVECSSQSKYLAIKQVERLPQEFSRVDRVRGRSVSADPVRPPDTTLRSLPTTRIATSDGFPSNLMMARPRSRSNDLRTAIAMEVALEDVPQHNEDQPIAAASTDHPGNIAQPRLRAAPGDPQNEPRLRGLPCR
jgi:hypothetical protein